MAGNTDAGDGAATFEPTEDQRRVARAMAGFGLPHPDIAVLLDIDVKTLNEHFERDLDRGAAEGTAKVAQTLFQMATVDRNVSAVIFWMKARAGWREKHDVEVSGKNGEPLPPPRLIVTFRKPDGTHYTEDRTFSTTIEGKVAGRR